MFNRLPESNASRQRRTGGFVVSTVVHLVLIALAVQATGLTAAPPPKPTIIDIVYPPPAPPRAPPQPNVDPRQSIAQRPSIPAPAELEFLPAIASDIPSTLPEPKAMEGLLRHLFDSTRESVAAAARSDGPPNVASDSPLTADVVEKAVVAIPGTATPRYPSMFQNAGVEGSVRAQFVVDTLGRVEPRSFHALEATHDLFTAAVRDALLRARFSPAEVGGRKVRQLVEQTFTFTIGR